MRRPAIGRLFVTDRIGSPAMMASRSSFRAAIGLFLLLAGCASAAPPFEPGEVIVEHIDRCGSIPCSGERGPLTLLAAVVLRSDDPRFGGLSGAALEGDRLVLVSDRGTLWRTPVGKDLLAWTQRPHSRWRVSTLGHPGEGNVEALDPEALTRDPAGRLVVALESDQRLYAIDAAGRLDRLTERPLIEGLPANQGIEALATRADGALLAIGEGTADGGSRHPVAIRDAERVTGRSYHPSSAGLAPSGADAAHGRLFVLERGFGLGGWRAAITVQEQGRRVESLVLDGLAPLDNMEAIAARAEADGTITLLVISDDNFLMLQETLLLLLRYRPGEGAAAGASPASARNGKSMTSAIDSLTARSPKAQPAHGSP